MNEDFYRQVRKRNEIELGTQRLENASRFRSLGAKIVYELIQNAEDAGAKSLGFQANADGLFAWNDGSEFSNENVRQISGLFLSDKDLTAIGYFGVGFKSVLNVTDCPYVFSGRHSFYLEGGLDPWPARLDEMPAKFIGAQKPSLFWLPWNREPAVLEARLLTELKELGSNALLGLESLNELTWQGVTTNVSIRLRRDEIAAGSFLIEMTYEEDGDSFQKVVSRWLKVSLERPLPKAVAEAAAAEDQGRVAERVRSSAGQEMRVSFIFYMDDDSLAATDGLVFARLPTGLQTGLKFHIDGRLSTTLARDNIQWDNPISVWHLQLMEELSSILPQRLQDIGWLQPQSFVVLPIEGEEDARLERIATKLRAGVVTAGLIPGSDEKRYKPNEVLLAHRQDLYDLLSADFLSEVLGNKEASWIHQDLRTGRAKQVALELGVREVEAGEVLDWLESRNSDWWQGRPVSWLATLCHYLAAMDADEFQERVRDLPFVRLRNGENACPRQAVLPPEEELPVVLQDDLELLPIVADELAGAEGVDTFLIASGAAEFDLEKLITRLFQSKYEGHKVPRPEQNIRDIRLLRRLWENGLLSEWDLMRWSTMSILRNTLGKYVAPSIAYLPEVYGGVPELKTYFGIAGRRHWVSADYVEKRSKKVESWRNFFLHLGVARLPKPRIMLLANGWNQEVVETKRVPEPLPESSSGYAVWDWQVDGFELALEQIERGRVSARRTGGFWRCLGRLWDLQPDEYDRTIKGNLVGGGSYYDEMSIKQGSLRWFYYTAKKTNFEAAWILRLRTARWIPDQDGTLCYPHELFHPSLQPALGDELRYPHRAVDIGAYFGLADEIGIQKDASVNALVTALRNRSRENSKLTREVQTIFELIANPPSDLEHDRDLRSLFMQEALIPSSDFGWLRSDEVCWEAESRLLPSLKSDWGASEWAFDFFTGVLGVQKRPGPDAYARYLLGWSERADPELARANELGQEIWKARRKAKLTEEAWRRLRDGACWPGKTEDGLVWESADELVINDDRHRATLFEGHVSWWALSGLSELAHDLGVSSVSDSVPVVFAGGTTAALTGISAQLARLWPCLSKVAEITAPPPDVRESVALDIRYRLRGAESECDKTVQSAYNRGQSTILMLSSVADDPADALGDALQSTTQVANLREFVKDLWHATSDNLSTVLRRWEARTGIELRSFGPLLMEGEREDERQEEDDGLGVTAPVDPSEQGETSPWPRNHGGGGSGSGGGPAPGRRRERSAQPTSEVAYQAMAWASKWLESQGYSVEDVSGYDYGYDLEARKAAELVKVEVKGRSQESEISLTENEHRVAEQNEKAGEAYWVIVVLVKPDGESGWLLRSPAQLEWLPRVRATTEYVVGPDTWLTAAEALSRG